MPRRRQNIVVKEVKYYETDMRIVEDAVIFGPLAVSQNERNGFWDIHHVATGMYLARLDTRDAAYDVAKKAQHFDWRFVRPIRISARTWSRFAGLLQAHGKAVPSTIQEQQLRRFDAALLGA